MAMQQCILFSNVIELNI